MGHRSKTGQTVSLLLGMGGTMAPCSSPTSSPTSCLSLANKALGTNFYLKVMVSKKH
jgi:hypothetical protein